MAEPVSPSTAPDRAPPKRAPGRVLPNQRTLLSWIFAARLAVAVATLVGASLLWTETPDLAFLVSVSVLLAFTVTVYGWWATWVREIVPGVGFLLVQAVVDLGVVTTVVHVTGGGGSPFPALFVVVIAAYAILMPAWAGTVTTLLAAGLYFADSYWAYPQTLDLSFWGQVAVLVVVFPIVAALGARLRRASLEQDSLQTELKRVRLEADEILRSIRSGVLTVDGMGRLAFINPTAARLLGVDAEAQLGHPILDQLQERSIELWTALTAGIRNGKKVSRAEGALARPDGFACPIGLSTTTFEPEGGGLPSVTALFADITDSKQLQELHLRAQRLEAVAALSASLAHEIRNPLASIRSSVEQLSRSARADDDERFLAQLIVRETDRLSRLLTQFLDFSRVRASRFVPVDLHEVAVAACQLVREHPDCSPGATLRVEGGSTVLDGDEDLLHRVVTNLLLNAVQSSRGAIDVSITTRRASENDLPEGCVMENPVCISVQDSGPGIPAEIRESLFQPFVTGRPGGTGLGLAIVQRGVEAHHGLVLVDSGPDRGTTFTIYMPARIRTEEAA